MGLFKMIKRWQEAMYKRKLVKARAKGICPDCRGFGYDPLMLQDHFTLNAKDFDCVGCKGTGSYTEWAKNNGHIRK
ncbi:hypothetical protein [Desertibacillus haloalkaliphilus]|uniref:hypothetical protein n=1 Tax=Desertibacillus haloalkaliphilus TaxID=1328930 RepID=UPI001C260CB9|nr:hypothetical protein [Desertibacillus haloalkaliphilus]MBU8905943.1 hypothetical protein [Desertibacillus haloalkaliphilus]